MQSDDALHLLNDVAVDQGGFVTTDQARAIGVTSKTMVELARRNLLERLLPRVYALAFGRPHSPNDELFAAWLALDGNVLPWERREHEPKAVVSHASAAALRGLGSIIPGLPEFTARRPASQRSELRLHTSQLDPRDWEWFMAPPAFQLPVTTPARTVTDLIAARYERDYLRRAILETWPSPATASRDLLAAADRRSGSHARVRAEIEPLLALTFPDNDRP
jgi:hypothetical protein